MQESNLDTAATFAAPGSVDQADRIGIVATALLSSLVTLAALTPVAYVLYRNLPPRLATVDLQLLVEDDQARLLRAFGTGNDVTVQQRDAAAKHTVDFAKKLSIAVDQLGNECNCVIVNKAALLSGPAIDYTDLVRARMK